MVSGIFTYIKSVKPQDAYCSDHNGFVSWNFVLGEGLECLVLPGITHSSLIRKKTITYIS